MSAVDAIILGLVQGIAEFLPISSSGHLILAREVLGLQIEQGLAVDAVLQLVTVFAVILYFRKDLWLLAVSAWGVVCGRQVEQGDKTMLWALALGTVPAIVAGLFLEDLMDTTFRSATLVAWVLIAGSGLFLLAEWVHARRARELLPPLTKEEAKREVSDVLMLSPSNHDISVCAPSPFEGEGGGGDAQRFVKVGITIQKGLLIGCFQALALIPGMSRSGATMSGGMLLGLSREQSARFAFLLSVPILLGAGGKKLLELMYGAQVSSNEWSMIALASFVAFASGIASIHYLLQYLRHHSLVVFVVYRVALAVLVLAMLG